MIERLIQRLIRVDVRMVYAGMCVLVALLAFEAWVLVLRAPLAERRALASSRTALQGMAQNVGIGAEIDLLTADTEANARALALATRTASDDDTVLMLIDTLGRLASRHGVMLGQVKAGRGTAFGSVEEQSFDIEARGEYHALHSWWVEARRELAPLLVVDMALRSIDDGQRIGMSLRLAAYRTAAAPKAAP